MARFKVGDKVKLHTTGAPEMSVFAVRPGTTADAVYLDCQWFASGRRLETGVFPEVALVAVMDEPPGKIGSS